MRYYIDKQVISYALRVILLILFASGMKAQEKSDISISPEAKAWTISTMAPWPPDKYASLKEAMIDNNFYIPIVFKGGMFPKLVYNFTRDSIQLNQGPPLPSYNDFKIKITSPVFSHYEFRQSLIDMVYREVMLKNPSYFKYSLQQLPPTINKPESIETSKGLVKLEVKPTSNTSGGVDLLTKFVPKRKYWKPNFAADVKFTYNKSSINWPKGEINNMNIHTTSTTSFDYEKNKVKVTNRIITKFAIVNAPKDTLRSYTIGDDELRLNNNYQIKATKNWNYSFSTEFVTPMGNKYAVNKEIKNSSFLAPFTVTSGIGMTYNLKPTFKKKDYSLDLTVILNSLSFSYKHSISRDINLGAHFKEKDKDGNIIPSFHTFGFQGKVNNTFKYRDKITLISRFDYFSNFEFVRSEFENKLDILLNKNFSTTMSIHLRYEDNVKKVEGSDTYLQVNKYFLFGFTYRYP